MADSLRESSLIEVIDFFKSIKGDRKNPGLIDIFKGYYPVWKYYRLTPQEFLNLICQTDPHKLLKDVDFNLFKENDRPDVEMKYECLIKGKILSPLIVRELGSDNYKIFPKASYYLEDGTGRSVAIKRFLEEGYTYEILAFVGFLK